MKHLRLTLLASAAIGLATLVSASAAPVSNNTLALDNTTTQNARLVCDQWGRCYQSRRHRHRYYDDGYHRRRHHHGLFGIF